MAYTSGMLTYFCWYTNGHRSFAAIDCRIDGVARYFDLAQRDPRVN